MLSQFCIKRPIFATVMAILIVLSGIISIRVLPVSQYPNITPPSVMISASYDGADIQTLSRTVAQPIEAQLSGIQGLLYYTTTLRSSGEVRIRCTFEVGTDPNDAVLEINNRVRTAERKLPQAVRNVGVSVRKRSSDNLLRVILTSPDRSMSPLDMADYANVNILDDLKRVPDIGDVMIFGNVESAMRVWVDPLRMAKLRVTTTDITSAISAQNTQYGVGRTGTLFAFQDYDIEPDGVSFAKGIAGGLPMGGFLVSEKARGALGPGTHGSTFGGNPIAASAALEVLSELDDQLLLEVREKGNYIAAAIHNMRSGNIKAIKGKGLMIGLELIGADAGQISQALAARGLLTLTAHGNVLRFLPPLVITIEEIDKGLAILQSLLGD